ncbi:MAG TPA: hypothetical protein VFJ82_14145 [Longimicrobium sp.]|nr:hypothetical protein [Longimicrobium sp.]
MHTPRWVVPVLAVLIALTALPAAGRAQARQLLGARVRVTAPPLGVDRFAGQVTQYDTANLVVRDTVTGTERTFPLHSIRLLEISHGTTRSGNATQRARLLAFLAGGVGAVAGAAVRPFGSAGKSIAIAGGGGALLGAAIGAAWGSSAPHERWEWAPRPFGYDPNTRAPLPAPPAPVTAPQP